MKMTQRISRRRFIQAATLGVVAAPLRQLTALADDKEWGEPYGGFKMGVQSYSLRGFSFDGCLERVQQLGLHYVEFFSAHVAITTDEAKIAAVKDKLAQYKIIPLAYGVEAFRADDAANRRKFEFAKLLGSKTITADPSPDSFASLDRLVEEFGIAIAIHNHGPGARYAKISDVAKAIEGRHKLIGACVDTGHFIRADEDPVEAVRTFGERTYCIHLKDVTKDRRFCVLGKGQLNTVSLLRELKKLHFSHCLALEYEENPQDPISDMQECLRVTREAVKKL